MTSKKQKMDSKKLTILVASCIETGHLNALTGETLQLMRRGHRVIFVLHELFKGKLAKLGFEEYIYSCVALQSPKDSQKVKPTDEEGPSKSADDDKSKAEEDLEPQDEIYYPETDKEDEPNPAQILHEVKLIGPYGPKEKLGGILEVLDSPDYAEEIRHTNRAIKEALEKFSVDLIIIDAHSLPPAVYYSGIPWIRSCSMAPTMEVWFDDVPPGGSGLPRNGDRSEWAEYNQIRRPLFFDSKIFSELVKKMGYEPYPGDVKFPPTDILTVYACPEELNFAQIRDSKNWFNLEAFNKVDASGVETPLSKLVTKQFYEDTLDGEWSGKWVYLSMGSIVSSDVPLMKRLTSVLAGTKHKYIVSKGKRHSMYKLPRNMWGGEYLPQTKIIPHVDLFITHGGNNSFTETFARGTPMVVLPVFADQYDNAQMLVDTGLGRRVDPYTFADQELLEAVEGTLNDQELKAKLQLASSRIQASKRHEELAEKIEQLIGK